MTKKEARQILNQPLPKRANIKYPKDRFYNLNSILGNT